MLGHTHIIIGLTGNSIDEELQEFSKSGADLVLTKPLKPHTLENVLKFVAFIGSKSLEGQKLVLQNNEMMWLPAQL